MFSGGPILWSSKKQKCVVLSTARAEYVALSGAAQECLWLRQLEVELGYAPEAPTLIFEDNQFTIAMAKNPQFHERAKHINICHHFVSSKWNYQTRLLLNNRHDRRHDDKRSDM